jgi:hypothetical protein
MIDRHALLAEGEGERMRFVSFVTRLTMEMVFMSPPVCELQF